MNIELLAWSQGPLVNGTQAQPEEIAEVALRHGERAKDPLISFGQGCEGDPCLAADNIAKAVKIIAGVQKSAKT